MYFKESDIYKYNCIYFIKGIIFIYQVDNILFYFIEYLYTI